ncbi:MAG: hypothetical protein ACK5YR_17045 [Pirellula sp.]|jgi:hypothetical protein
MKIPPAAQQMIDIARQSAETQQAISTAVLAKQNNAAKQQGDAVLQLLNTAANVPSRGIDVRA